MAWSALSPELAPAVERWSAIDPDPSTRARLAELVASDPDTVARLFAGRIAFGTAGLRAEMGPGPTRMNRLVVRQTTAGLMRWLEPAPLVIIGYDARRGSEAFARDAAAVVAGAGGTAELLPGPLPTPVLAHAVLDRAAAAGIMITASHNPAADNGYKLYLGDGIQLVDPADAEIAAEIDAVAAAMADPARDVTDALALVPLAPDRVVVVDDTAARKHLAAAVDACVTGDRDVQVLYTAMHGVGGKHLVAAFEAAGFPRPHTVDAQFDPDPNFSTTPFPNPEEPGALDLAFADAAGGVSGRPVDVILANDPDADRLAVAVPDRSGQWTRLSGDQVGVLLADHLIGNGTGTDRLVASSLVSSRMISALAAATGIVDVRTLTGFKWVARPIVERSDLRYVLGYEEALGYCVGDRVRDKDGISAALVMAELVAGAITRGETLWDVLDRLAVAHGLHLTAPVTLVFDGADGSERREAAMQRVRTAPPRALAGVGVAAVEDLADGVDLPPTDGIVWHLDDGARVIVRPSGTEPKLKAYLEVIEPVGSPPPSDPSTPNLSTAPASSASNPQALPTRRENEAATIRAEARLRALAAAVEALLRA